MALRPGGHLERLHAVGAHEADPLPPSAVAPPAPPPGFDMDRFRRGQRFFMDHIFSCASSMLMSLVAGLSVSNLLEPLVYTRRSDTPLKAIVRYANTFHHVVLWHHGDPWDPADPAYRSVSRVRQMHNAVRQRMTKGEDLASPPVSQYNMSLVQCGFMGGIVMYPESGGIACTRADLADYCYFWYGIGHLLGIPECNNICRGSLAQTTAICKEIEADVLLPALRDPPHHFMPMAQALVDGMNLPFRAVRPHSVTAFLHLSLSFMGQPLPPMAWADRIRVFVWRALAFLVRYVPGCRTLLNSLTLKGISQKFLSGEITVIEPKAKHLRDQLSGMEDVSTD